mgnify:CR=1 FL=1
MLVTRYIFQLARYRLGYYMMDMIGFAIRLIFIPLTGLVLRAFFNYLTGEEGTQLGILPSTTLQLIFHIIAGTAICIAIWGHIGYKYHNMALMIRNMLERILTLPGGQPLPLNPDGSRQSAGQVISTMRDDTNDVVELMVVYLDLFATALTAFVSFYFMWQVSPAVTLGVLVPLAIIIFASQALGRIAKRLRKNSREATSQVTGLIADMFTSTETIKAAHAEEHIVAHFAELNDARRVTMVRDRFLTQIVEMLNQSTTAIGTGLILLFAAQAMYDGRFTVGDFALFTTYLWPISVWMRTIGMLITRNRQVSVSFDRMETIMQNETKGTAVAHQPTYMDGIYPALPKVKRTPADRLDLLTARGLTYHYDEVRQDDVTHAQNGTKNGTKNGIEDISLTLPRGSFIAITGRIGSGKTTLLKTLIGLLPAQSGEIQWNGVKVDQPDSFFVPPRSAFTPQAPRLFSETLRNNILLGVDVNDAALHNAIEQAVLERDLAEMEHGLATEVGSRGVRLSGGQVQRTSAARMFVRKPELLVFDDLSSALDVETEQLLWERLFNSWQSEQREDENKENEQQSMPTCLVVTHRQRVLQRADHVIVMAHGHILDEGPLDDLLERCEEMQSLWSGEEQLA